MTELLKRLVRSTRSFPSPFYPERQYIRPKVGDGAMDFHRVTGDMRLVGKDLQKTTTKELKAHGK